MSCHVDDMLGLPPFGVSAEAKAAALLPAVREELVHHYENCPPFGRWCRKQGFDPHGEVTELAAVPFLPVNIFKRLTLCSVPEEQVVRILTSSATSSQVPSRVALDEITRTRQMRALAAILTARFGGQRRPFIILDAPPDSGAAGQQEISARAAGMRGYLMAASAKQYVFRSGTTVPSLDVDLLRQTVDRLKQSGQPFSFLGYTYLVYQYVVRPLHESGLCLELPEDVQLLHFGGWKKLAQLAVSREVFNAQAAEVFGLPRDRICDIYGFTEQLGVIYPDGADGVKRVPTYAEVFVRDFRTLEIVPDGQAGFLEFICPLPHSYPGVAVLLDDIGRVVSRDRDPGATAGTGFEVLGRARRAEARGCGDTLPDQVYHVSPTAAPAVEGAA